MSSIIALVTTTISVTLMIILVKIYSIHSVNNIVAITKAFSEDVKTDRVCIAYLAYAEKGAGTKNNGFFRKRFVWSSAMTQIRGFFYSRFLW